ncbi:MAG: restriction system-associated AAA family ATPase [Verrucomicrobiota bacterium]
MKLLRLKITDPKGFRSLQEGFEYHFRRDWQLDEGKIAFAPFVCAGPNGSGKSNLLEALALIFYQLEVLRVRRRFLPENFPGEEDVVADAEVHHDILDAYELEYQIYLKDFDSWTDVLVSKIKGESPDIYCNDVNLFEPKSEDPYVSEDSTRSSLLPEFVLGYSSGENEILSLSFFKMRFIQYDEYLNALQKQLPYPGRPETRMAYLDNSFSQAILITNLLFYQENELAPFKEDIGIGALKEFRIVIRRSIQVDAETASLFEDKNPALIHDSETGTYTVDVIKLLEADDDSAENFDPIVTRLKRCATCYFVEEATDTLHLDYWVNDATREAFSKNFDFAENESPIALFQAFQVLLTLNLYSVSLKLKEELYHSDSHYVNETVPTLASDERIMRFKYVRFMKEDSDDYFMLKSLSDGEHQLLHSLGLCMLFKNTNSLFLLDEPETHFNPDWRSNFITRLHQCFKDSTGHREMLITTHTPFLISDSQPDKVLVFSKEDGIVSVQHPEYNTLGASINKITMNTFNKEETIGRRAQTILEELKNRVEAGESKEEIIELMNSQLGDSIEKMLAIKSILNSEKTND